MLLSQRWKRCATQKPDATQNRYTTQNHYTSKIKYMFRLSTAGEPGLAYCLVTSIMLSSALRSMSLL